MARDDRGICLQRGRRRGEREREGKSLDDTRNRGISRCFNNRAGFDKSVTSMNFCRALEFFAGQRWWWWWWWVGLSRSRDVSRKIHFTVLHAAVLPTACRRKITKKKRKKGRGEGIEKRKKGKKKGRIDRPRRVHYALLYARALYAILFVVSRRLGELLFFSLLLSVPLPRSPRSISLRHGRALCVISIPMTEEKWKATG